MKFDVNDQKAGRNSNTWFNIDAATKRRNLDYMHNSEKFGVNLTIINKIVVASDFLRKSVVNT